MFCMLVDEQPLVKEGTDEQKWWKVFTKLLKKPEEFKERLRNLDYIFIKKRALLKRLHDKFHSNDKHFLMLQIKKFNP